MDHSIKLGLLAALLFFQSCTNSGIKNKAVENEDPLSANEQVENGSKTKEATNSLTLQQDKDLIGNWVGIFEPDTAIIGVYTGDVSAWNYDNKINLSIDQINGEEIQGHSVIAGNDRPFKGNITRKDNSIAVKATEPGDDKEDGEFNFSIGKGDTSITGTWAAYKKVRIPKRKYILSKKIFKYNPDYMVTDSRYIDWKKSKKVKSRDENDDFIYDESYLGTTEDVKKYNASKVLITAEQAANLKKADLFIIRNSIYARHGYSFRNQQLRAYFDREPWYIPVTANIKADFTEIEKKNIAMLLRYEKNAEEYYDVFGRG